jgi:GTP-binding protein Era
VPVVIVLNKVDRLKASHVAGQMKEAATLGDFHALHPVSAKTRDGIGELRDDLLSLLPEGPLYYPAGEVTDLPLDVRIAELVREQALRLTKEEVPHAVTAEVVEIDDRRVHVRIYTETESQKQILIGKGGTMVREIGRSARPAIEQLLGREIYLQLQVKASPKWRRNETMLERLGL